MNRYHVIVITDFGRFSKTYEAPSYHEAWEAAHDTFWPLYSDISVEPVQATVQATTIH